MNSKDYRRTTSVSPGIPYIESRLHFLLRRAKQVQRQWRIIEDGDRILLGLSGGKDSMALLYLLRYWQRFSPDSFEFAALHVETAGLEGNAERRAQLEEHLEAIDVPLDFVGIEYPEGGNERQAGFRCFRCSRRRRESLFKHAVENGFNKVALAHHLDDAAETALMNLFFHSSLDTMEPKVEFFDGKITVIRPLVLAEEREVARLSKLIDFPFFRCNCPDLRTTERDRVKDFIRSFGREAKAVKRNIWSATREWPGRLTGRD